jgi:hypothetical protein
MYIDVILQGTGSVNMALVVWVVCGVFSMIGKVLSHLITLKLKFKIFNFIYIDFFPAMSDNLFCTRRLGVHCLNSPKNIWYLKT